MTSDEVKQYANTLSDQLKWQFLRDYPEEYDFFVGEELKEIESEEEFIQEATRFKLLLSHVSDFQILLPCCKWIEYACDAVQVMKCCTNLTKLNLKNFSNESVQNYLPDLIKTLPRLIELDFSNNEDLHDSAFDHIDCSKITHLYFRNCSITGDCLKKFSALQSLDLEGCDNVTDEILQKISSRSLSEINLSQTNITGLCFSSPAFQSLKHLHASSCSEISDEDLKQLSSRSLKTIDVADTPVNGSFLSGKAYETVEEINLTACSEVTDKTLVQMSCQSLKKANFNGIHLNGECLQSPVFGSIEELAISGSKMTDSHIQSILSRSLKKIAIEAPIDGSCFSSDLFKTVEKLSVISSQMREENVARLSSQSLTNFSLEDSSEVTGAFLELPQFSALKKLILNNCRHVTEEHLGKIVTRSLKQLHLKNNPMITGKFLGREAFQKITDLNIWGCNNIKELLFADLRCTSTLEKLNLGDCGGTGAAVRSVIFPSLQELNLSYLPLTDLDLQQVLSCPLKSLYLSGTEVTAQALLTSEAIKSIQDLSISECPNITKEEAEEVFGYIQS